MEDTIESKNDFTRNTVLFNAKGKIERLNVIEVVLMSALNFELFIKEKNSIKPLLPYKHTSNISKTTFKN
jgi:hypothetical protein